MRRTRVIAAVLCAGLLVPAAAVAAPAAAPAPAESVESVKSSSARLILSLSRHQVSEYLARYDLTGPVRHGVDLYVIRYRTAQARTASALTVVPHTHKRRLDPVVWLHGTRVFRGDAATISDNMDRAAAVLLAASGHVTVAPDYLGLGEGTGPHPYMVSRPTVAATVDALKASRFLLARNGKWLSRDVRLSGFSQGGQAAVLVGRELQRRGELTAVAAIAGPYDIRGHELPAALDGRLNGVSATLYLAYAVTAWNRYYPIYSSPSEAFRAPYDRIVEPLFDGGHQEADVVAALPSSPQELFTDGFLAELANPTGPLADFLAENDDPCAWHPKVPVRLYAGTADRDVVFGNAESCQAQLGNARLVNVGPVDHFTSARKALPEIANWFAGS